jgi:hypothetical protein
MIIFALGDRADSAANTIGADRFVPSRKGRVAARLARAETIQYSDHRLALAMPADSIQPWSPGGRSPLFHLLPHIPCNRHHYLLKHGGTLEHAQQIAAHEFPCARRLIIRKTSFVSIRLAVKLFRLRLLRKSQPFLSSPRKASVYKSKALR